MYNMKNVKNNIISLLFINILLFAASGCNSNITGYEPCNNCELSIAAPSLQIDDNGYYHMEFLDGYVQTFTTLDAYTNHAYIKLSWVSATQIYIGGEWTNIVNPAAYTDESGTGHTVLAAWESMVGDTLKVGVGYQDNCNIWYTDSLQVIID